MRSRLSFGFLFSLGGVGCLILLGLAYLLQYWHQLTPCPLCLFQRYTFWLITLVFLVGSAHQSKAVGRILYCGLLLILNGMGILFASRQLWLQHLPPEQMPACTAGLELLLTHHSILETLGIVIADSGECGLVDFKIFGLPLAAWSLVGFIGIMIYVITVLILQKKRRI
jgi:disulfide bond formation protein DsbB